MTIRDFLRVMWDGKYYLVTAVVVALLAALVYADRKPEVYEATATVQINAADLGDGTNPATTTTVDTDPRLVEAPGVVEMVGEAVRSGATTPEALAAQISGQFDAGLQVMTITAQAGTPDGAVELANAVASAYVESLPTVIDGQIAELDERRDALRAQLKEVDGEVRDNPKDPLAGAERDTIISQYQTLSASRSTLESIVTPAQVLTPASGSSAVVVGLPRFSIVALGALAGLAVGAGLALARRALDSRLRTRVEATVAAGVPVLAELYGVSKAAKTYGRMPVLPISSRIASPFTESIRELRTAVHVAMQDREHAVVVVTATDPHAPRSFIAANLAASWAMSGQATVAVSGDLRRPVLDDLLPPSNGTESDAEGLRTTQVPNLRFLALQDPTMDPADYLATARVRGILEAARDAGEVLVIDAPPVLAAADATILGAYADCVVLVATAGRTERSVLTEAADRLRINGVPLTGVALAGVKGDSRMVYASTYGDLDSSGSGVDPREPKDTVKPSEEGEVDDAEPAGEGAPTAAPSEAATTPPAVTEIPVATVRAPTAAPGTSKAAPPSIAPRNPPRGRVQHFFPPTGIDAAAEGAGTDGQADVAASTQPAPSIGNLLRATRRS